MAASPVSVLFVFSSALVVFWPLMWPHLAAKAALLEGEALIQLKKSFANATALASWTGSPGPCGEGTGESDWAGVVCFQGLVTGLRLSDMGLAGTIDVDALMALPALRSVSFINNSFSGPIPEFNRLGALKSIYLTRNLFSGEIPDDYFVEMDSLKKLWIGGNAFSGAIPSSLAIPPHLMELHLENNKFSGVLPNFKQSTLSSFDVSHNPMLEGMIPQGLEKFDRNSFIDIPNLCGGKLGKECTDRQPNSDHTPAVPAAVPSVPAASPPGAAAAAAAGPRAGKMDSSRSKAIGVVLVLVLSVLTVLVVVVRRKTDPRFDTLGGDHRRSIHRDQGAAVAHTPYSPSYEYHQTKGSSGHPPAEYGGAGGRKAAMGELVVLNEGAAPAFGLPDLMKAAAEVLGDSSGGLGQAYKAVMASGAAVVVKRMKEMNRVGQDGFNTEMRRLGRLHHPNILSPLAFLYRKEEKLLVYDYISGGSLLYLLHGNFPLLICYRVKDVNI